MEHLLEDSADAACSVALEPRIQCAAVVHNRLEIERSDLRALQILEAIGDEPALRVLGRLAEGAPASPSTREARAAVDRMAHR